MNHVVVVHVGFHLSLPPILTSHTGLHTAFPKHQKMAKEKSLTYNSRDSLVVTHVTTSPPVRCLSRAERTGSLAVSCLITTKALKMTVCGILCCHKCIRDRYFVKERPVHANAKAQRFCVRRYWPTIMSLRSARGARTRYVSVD
jgi:hypothetical protein